MGQLEKNTVKADNQLSVDKYISFDGDGTGLRVMIVGNSMTRHGVLESIGWPNDYGMAASDKDHDFAHVLMKKIRQKTKASFCICQVSIWEQGYKNGSEILPMYKTARDFDADIIVMRVAENCPGKDYDREIFLKEYDNLVQYLNKSGKAKISVSTSFWKHPADNDLVEYAEKNGYPSVMLYDLGELDEMKAIGLFWHKGVANHPGDRGMQAIADRIWEKIEDFIPQE